MLQAPTNNAGVVPITIATLFGLSVPLLAIPRSDGAPTPTPTPILVLSVSL